MLDSLDPLVQPILIVIREYRYLLPQDDRPSIDRGRDVVDRGACYRQSLREGVSHHSRAAQGREQSAACEHLDASVIGQQRWVDVDDPARKAVQKRRSEYQHPAGEYEQIGLECAKHVGKQEVKFFARDRVVATSERQRHRGYPRVRREPQRAGFGAVTDDERHLCIERTARDGVEQRLQVRPRA